MTTQKKAILIVMVLFLNMLFMYTVCGSRLDLEFVNVILKPDNLDQTVCVTFCG